MLRRVTAKIVATGMQVTSPVPTNQASGVVFVDKYVQPSQDQCMNSLVQKYYSALDVYAMTKMTALQQTGALHTALYDFEENAVLFSWATENATGGFYPAYER